MQSLTKQLEDLIVRRSLTAGARLPPERALATELGVSRSRLREAIQHLVSRGLVVSRQGGGNFVAERTAEQSLEQVLKPLEPLIRDEADYWRDVMEIRKSISSGAGSRLRRPNGSPRNAVEG